MPPAPRREGLWLGLAVTGLAGACLGAGWWLGQLQSGGGPDGPGSRPGLERQAADLRRRMDAGEASVAEQQRLLELLVALDRKAEATPLLERLADQQPERWSLRLLLAEVRRDQGDRSGAERELRQLLNQRPDQVEALQLMALIQVETGRTAQAVAQLEAALKRAITPKLRDTAVPIGLLLANVHQRQGQPGKAEAELIKLNTQFPKDPRPLLARALIQQERGDTGAAQNTLAQARALGGDKGDPRLDEVAASWGLEALRPKPAEAPLRENAAEQSPERPAAGSQSP
ncbi:tetratricopeptide repeat protein [Cyanobium sp. NIES-981]|uniref:tetratricopeptide repeat protein n=1 Tax=Cyanobium sp. NIES-981 TaxID=1851505 RepID=UPI0007DD82EC|nr:tetratricopeptide repeat protein [Cyanobium sp. NIES-981]SBO41780.1 Tetratricopeptide repeat domain protein [Cyanobium sp. NIES-981]